MVRSPVLPWHRTLYVALAFTVGALLASGVVVCVTNASSGCPDWPRCYGRLIPPPRLRSILEWSHRVLTALNGPLLLLAVGVALRRHRHERWIFRPLLLGVLGILVVSAFGAAAVLWGLPRPLAALDLASALVTLALVTTAAAAAFRAHSAGMEDGLRPAWTAPEARLALWAAAAGFLTLASGVWVAEPGSVVRCASLPFWGASPREATFYWLDRARFLFGVVTAGLILLAGLRLRPELPRLSLALLVLLAGEVGVGLWLTVGGLSDLALSVHAVLAVSLWGTLVALAVSAGFVGAAADGEAPGEAGRAA